MVRRSGLAAWRCDQTVRHSALEARGLLTTARGDRLEALYALAVYTGMRRGELLALRWSDVSLGEPGTESGVVRVRRTLSRTEDGNSVALGDKTKKSGRTIRLTPGAQDALKRHRTRQAEERLKTGSAYQDRALVFATRVGTPINPSNLRNRSFVPLLKKAGLPQITFHDLRHTTASLLFSKNVHPKFVQELLGHASVAFTLDTYFHMLPGMGGEAADAMGQALG
jgi:integrase